MEMILKTMLIYNPNKPHITVRLDNDDAIDTVALERHHAGWYATLDYTDTNGIPHSIRPDSWIRYRDTYILEYNTNDTHYTVKITEHAQTNEVSVCVLQESLSNDEEHTDAYAPVH